MKVCIAFYLNMFNKINNFKIAIFKSFLYNYFDTDGETFALNCTSVDDILTSFNNLTLWVCFCIK